MKTQGYMPRVPKGDPPSLAYFFLLLAMLGLMFIGVGIGIVGFAELLKTLMWAAS